MRFRTRQQISVVLRNHPGTLAELCETLAAEGINIEALSMIDTLEHGLLRFVADSNGKASAMLERVGLQPIEAEVLELTISSAPGRLQTISRELAAAGVNIQYAYGSQWEMGGPMTLFFKVSDPSQAAEVLERLD